MGFNSVFKGLISVVDNRNIKLHAGTSHPYGVHAVRLITDAKHHLKVTERARK